jgi:hypothetical protein
VKANLTPGVLSASSPGAGADIAPAGEPYRWVEGGDPAKVVLGRRQTETDARAIAAGIGAHVDPGR